MPEEELGGMEGMRLFVHTDHFKELNLGFALDEGIGNGFHGFPANSPHDKIPPWWEYVINR